MWYRLKRYWAEILVFGAIFGVLIICLLPDMTWINTDSDGPHYILSAKYMGVAHNTSAPLFLLLGRLFLFLPFGTEAWRMGLISVLATTGCAVLIYMVVKQHLLNIPRARLYALIASLIYGGSALVISQSTIIETYALSTMLSVGAYYCCLKKKWIFASVLMGITLAIHPLFFLMTWVVLFIAHKELRRVKLIVLTYCFVLFYLYIPISRELSNTTAMWGNSSFAGFFRNNIGTMWMLAGGLSMWDLPKRLLDTFAMLGVSLGLGLIVAIWYFIKRRTTRSVLLWLILIPIVYFIVNLSPETYVYMIPSIAFASIVVGIGLSKMHMSFSYSVALVALILLAFNVNYFDIGRTLDPNLSARKFYNEELPKVKDGEILMSGGWTWAIIYLYNQEEGRSIVPVCIDVLPSQEYLDMLESDGIKLERTFSENLIDKQWLVAISIADNNPDVWIVKETVARQLESAVVPAKGNEWLMTRWFGHERTPEISWRPSNPYDFISGSLEVIEWKFILHSSHNMRFLFTWGTFGFFLFWIFDRYYLKRKKKVNKHGILPKI